MRYRNAACALFVCLLATPLSAQTAPGDDTERTSSQKNDGLVPAPSWAYNDLACAPALRMQKPTPESSPTLRVVGVQDLTHRDLLAPPDVLVISGGSNAGVQAGQRYFVRRVRTYLTDTSRPATIITAGWVEIQGVDTMVSTATIVHSCDGILLDDYLEPFVEPTVPARPLSGNVPQYENMGHIMTGIEGLHTAGTGNYMTIDRGTEAGVVVGQRFLVFRDKRNLRVETTGRSPVFAELVKQSPLVEIGEALVISVRPNDSTVRITVAKTAITTGDLIAPIR
jgi:hypothetical protein